MNPTFLELSPKGPAIGVKWEKRQIETPAGAPLSVLVLPDANNTARISAGLARIYYYMPNVPLLSRDENESPIFSLTLVLSRKPEPQEESIQTLIQQCNLAMDLSLALSEKEVSLLSKMGPAEYRPLFASQVNFSLESGDSILGQVRTSNSGADARVGLGVTLGRDDTLEVLSALQRNHSNLQLVCRIKYRTSAATLKTFRLEANWASIYDFLESASGPEKELTRTDLMDCFIQMLHQGTITVESGGLDSSLPADTDDIIPLFNIFMRMSIIILQRLTLEIESENSANRYALGARPTNLMLLDFRQTLRVGGADSLDLAAPLEEVIGSALKEHNLEAYLHLVTPNANGIGLEPIPRKMRTTKNKSAPGLSMTHLAAIGNSVESLSLALSPNTRELPQINQLLTSGIIKVSDVSFYNANHWAVNNIVFGWPNWWQIDQPEERNLPVVDDPNAALWPDRLESSRYWYAPEFEVVMPTSSATAANTPFRFRISVSGHDQSGQPGLEGTVQITLIHSMSSSTLSEWQRLNKPKAEAVAFTRITVGLELPFRDEKGKTCRQLFPADEIDIDNNKVTATFHLIDNWARLCYGPLAIERFQTESARVSVSYTYEAYIPVQKNDMELLYGGKIQLNPIVVSPVNPVVISAQSLSVKLSYPNTHQAAIPSAFGELLFVPEAPALSDTSLKGKAGYNAPPPSTDRSIQPSSNLSRPTPLLINQLQLAGNISFQPKIEWQTVLDTLIQQKEYGIQMQGSTQYIEVFFPCDHFGALYVQSSDTGDETIGCKEAFKLGQTEYRQYKFLEELNHSLYKVYRSLQMPGRFLVVPATYRITRFASTEGEKAYRPAILLYSTIDSNDLHNSRCVVMATVQPDLPSYMRRELIDQLADYHPNPIIEYITEIPNDYRVEWSIPNGQALKIQPEVSKLWDSLQVGLTTDVEGVPQLQAMLAHGGIQAGITFSLPDGTSLHSGLKLNLSEIVGPWEGGPVEVSMQTGGVQLTNKIERNVNVSDLRVYFPKQEMQIVRVDQRISKGEAWHGTIPDGAVDAYPVYTSDTKPVALEEIRGFIEDISILVSFVNLVNYANHSLKKLEIEARLKGIPGAYAITVEEAAVGAQEIALALTRYLANPILQFRVAKTDTTDHVTFTNWMDWSLTTQGNIISLTWELIK